MKFMLAVALLAATTAGAATDSSGPVWEVTLCLDTEQRTFALHEPVPVKVTWKNQTQIEQRFDRVNERVPRPMAIAAEGADWRDMQPYVTQWLQRGEVMFAPAKVGPNESFQCTFWLLLGAPVESKAWEFLFNSTGKWRIAWPSTKESFLEFTVTDPRPSDAKAYDLFSKDAAMVFLGEDMDAALGTKDLTSIATHHPDSLYAAYAIVALATIERRSYGKKEADITAVWLETVIHRHQSGRLGEAALDLAIAKAVRGGDYTRAIELYRRLKAAFPESSYVKLHGALENATPGKVIFKRSEGNEP